MITKNFFHLLLATLLTSTILFGQQEVDWKSKIDPAIFQKAMVGEEVEVIVQLLEQADVAEARFIPKKEEKGAFVYQRLTEVARRTQGNVLEIIRDFGAPHQSFWIANAVWTKGGMALLENLARLPEVKAISPNPSARLEEPQRPDDDPGSRSTTCGIQYINADDVWTLGYTGQGAVVGGQDTGYKWDHEALKLKYRGWDNTSMTADHNYNWYDAIDENAPQNSGVNPCGYNLTVPCDDDNHGTHTMGTMTGDDGGSNQIGVAPGAKWMGCRNMERGWGKLNWYLQCFQFFLAPTKLNGQDTMPSLAPHVINNSWYCPEVEGCDSGNFATMETAVDNLRAAGVVVVVSAGNSGPDCGTVSHPPAMFPGSFSVGATNSSGTIANFSSRGPTTYNSQTYLKPNVSAPGVTVYSSLNNGMYGNASGTSMAGPHVAGAVALLISAKPSLAGQVELIETLLEDTATGVTTSDGCGGNSTDTIPNNTYGYGIIDALAAVNAALALLPVELIRFSGMLEGKAVRLTWDIALPGSLNHFEIEHADSRLQWAVVGKVAFSTEMTTYGYLHGKPHPGTNYYRLKMVDIDGSIEYSKIVVLQLSDNQNFAIFPNPSAGMLSLLADWKSDELKIRIFDAGGRLAQEVQGALTKGESIFCMDVTALPPGVYFIQAMEKTGGNSLFQNKFVKL